jgi:hypothetical protein
MKHLQMGIRSSQRKDALVPVAASKPTDPALCNEQSTNSLLSEVQPFPTMDANIIENNNTSSDANIFCFAAFADKRTVILCNDLTRTFPIMSLEGNVCFLVVYHYKPNSILVLTITGFSDEIIVAAYQQQYNLLKLKRYKIHLNVMDNQATKVIKKFLDEENCNLLLVEPHNHRVNAAKCAIQTFKAHFISILATIDSKFPLQLWDRLTPQVESTLNMMRPSCINPRISAYQAVHGPYD